MIAAAGDDPSRLRPHVKTHKMPPIVQMQLGMGITRFKAATIAEAEMTAAAGGEDVLVAYPLVGPNASRLVRLDQAYPEVRFSGIVDCVTTAGLLNASAASADTIIDVYIDVDVGMHRTGIPVNDVVNFAEHLSSLSHLHLAGLHAYDGHLTGLQPPEIDRNVDQTFAPLWPVRESLEHRHQRPLATVAGGTPTSISLLRHPGVEVSAGTMVFNDAGQSRLAPGLDFQPAATAVTRVISHPGSDRVCLDLGHKAIASEMPAPRIEFFNLDDVQAIAHSEEHLVIQAPGAEQLNVGDVLYGLPTHICPTIALHNEVGVVQDGRLVDRWPVVARDRTITI